MFIIHDNQMVDGQGRRNNPTSKETVLMMVTNCSVPESNAMEHRVPFCSIE